MTTTPRETASVRSPGELITLLPYQLGYRPRRSLVAVMVAEGADGRATVGPVMRVDLPGPDGEGPRSGAGRRAAGEPWGAAGPWAERAWTAHDEDGVAAGTGEGPPLDPALHELGQQLLHVLATHQVDAVHLLAFEDEDEDEDADQDGTAALGWLAALCSETGLAGIGTVARVRGDRWCRLDEEGQPSLEALVWPRWQPLPDPADVPAVALYVLHGRGHVADREALSRPLDEDGPVLTHEAVRQQLAVPGSRPHPASGEAPPLLDDESVPDRERTDRWAAVWAHVLREGAGDLDAGELAMVLRSLRSLPFRDALLWWMTPEQEDAEGGQCRARTHRGQPEVSRVLRAMLPDERPDRGVLLERLQALAVRLPREHRGPVLAVLGVVAWWHGDGTLANLAAERSLQQEPGYRLALLLDLALQRAVPPPGYADRQ